MFGRIWSGTIRSDVCSQNYGKDLYQWNLCTLGVELKDGFMPQFTFIGSVLYTQEAKQIVSFRVLIENCQVSSFCLQVIIVYA